MGKLVHFKTDGTPRHIRLDRERMTIGRRPDNDICLPYPAVSGAHAAVVTILQDSSLEDLGSTNGTLVNGRPVTKHFLRDRDEIDVGREILVYAADDTAQVELPATRPDRRGETTQEGAPAASRPPPPAAEASRERRTGDAPAVAARAADARDQPVADAIQEEPLPPPTPAIAAPAPVLYAMRVLDGSGAGRLVPLRKSETLIGRAGVQVAALRRTADEVRVVAVEGKGPPSVNGAPVPKEGQLLAAGDVLEIGGVRLEFVVPGPVHR